MFACGVIRDMYLMTLGGIIGIVGYNIHLKMVAIAEYRSFRRTTSTPNRHPVEEKTEDNNSDAASDQTAGSVK